MKLFKFLRYTVVALTLLVGLASCGEDFLDRPPLDTIVDANYFNTSEEVLSATAPLYSRTWFGYMDKASFAIGDGRAGIYRGGWASYVQHDIASTDEQVRYSWYAFYSSIGQCNAVIRNIDTYASADVPAAIKKHGIAEARFMRGVAYLHLVRLWGAVPILENNLKVLTDTTITRNTTESVYEFIIRDFRYAAKNLPETPIHPGRLTRWAGEGMLAKAFLALASEKGSGGSRDQVSLDSAKFYAGSVCKNSDLDLLPAYKDLFLTKNDNNAESLAALQWIHNGNYGSGNPIASQLAFSSNITGTGDGWGGGHGATAELVKYYVSNQRDSLRRKATFMFTGDYYDYIHEIMPDGKTEAPLMVKNKNANIKKYIPGLASDNDGQVARQANGNNTYILRLAEVYLMYAEAILGNNASTADEEALTYFNLVRLRAGMPELTSISFLDILNEKRVEFAMEHMFWYELVNWYNFDPSEMKAYVNSQDRGVPTVELIVGSDPKQWSATYSSENYTLTDSDVMLPYPEVELARAPNLKKEPTPYNFD
jgi:starch-binding outer membrane protein, SusD/RagB family